MCTFIKINAFRVRDLWIIFIDWFMVEGNSMLLSPAVNRAIFVSNKIKGDLIQRNKGNDFKSNNNNSIRYSEPLWSCIECLFGTIFRTKINNKANILRTGLKFDESSVFFLHSDRIKDLICQKIGMR